MPLPRSFRTAAGLAVMALCARATFAEDIRQTPHNLARSNRIEVTEAGQICVFCHTPTDNDPDDAVQPLWQQSVVASTFSFLMFDDIGRVGFDGSTAVGSQSVACLSCHDAAQAFSVSALSFDHPFGVPYAGALSSGERERARETARESGAPIHEAKLLKFEGEFRPAYRGIVDNQPSWWASRAGNQDRRRREDLPLFVRVSESDQREIPFIECASCHDPHSVNELFLRVSQADGGICLTCHIK